MGNTLEFCYVKGPTLEDPFGKTVKYQFVLNGSTFTSSVQLNVHMTNEDVLRKIIEETLHQMLSRTAWESIQEIQLQ